MGSWDRIARMLAKHWPADIVGFALPAARGKPLEPLPADLPGVDRPPMP